MSWSESLESMCHEFFHIEQLRRFLGLFWAFWNPNWPAVHQATFDVSSTSPSLVAAMAILGASLSSDSRDRAMAHLWFNPTELLVFDDQLFSQTATIDWNRIESKPVRKSHLETLQAAYCVVLYQTWEGSKESKRRVRRIRYSAIISLARDIGFSSASLSMVQTSSITGFDWNEYILRESLIRVFHYIFALDSAFAMFNRHPPRTVDSELVMDLASPEACFRAQSAEECFVALKVWRDGLVDCKITTVSTAITAICSGHIPPSGIKLFERLSVLNMFTLVSVLYSMSFRLETSIIYDEVVTRIQAGLDNWKELWPSPTRDEELMSYRTIFDDSEAFVGFMRYAPEYWLFTRLTLEGTKNSTMEERSSVARCEDTDMAHLKHLLRSFAI
ncbi:hypothetical protein CC79DRAFT_1338399 [Sarocladium strictum]